MIETVWYLLLSSVLFILVIINTIAVLLYNKAYYEMHKTLMIKSVYYLLFSLLIEHILFSMISFAYLFESRQVATLLQHPLIMIIFQLPVVFCGIYFIKASLSPTKYYEESKQ